jgi:flagellar basal body-associated protein FliL
MAAKEPDDAWRCSSFVVVIIVIVVAIIIVLAAVCSVHSGKCHDQPSIDCARRATTGGP